MITNFQLQVHTSLFYESNSIWMDFVGLLNSTHEAERYILQFGVDDWVDAWVMDIFISISRKILEDLREYV